MGTSSAPRHTQAKARPSYLSDIPDPYFDYWEGEPAPWREWRWVVMPQRIEAAKELNEELERMMQR